MDPRQNQSQHVKNEGSVQGSVWNLDGTQSATEKKEDFVREKSIFALILQKSIFYPKKNCLEALLAYKKRVCLSHSQQAWKPQNHTVLRATKEQLGDR